jgi:hypothetical protein
MSIQGHRVNRIIRQSLDDSQGSRSSTPRSEKSPSSAANQASTCRETATLVGYSPPHPRRFLISGQALLEHDPRHPRPEIVANDLDAVLVGFAEQREAETRRVNRASRSITSML